MVGIRGSIGNIHNPIQDMRLMEQKILSVIDSIENATAPAIIYGLEPAFKLSQELVPKDTRKLMGSGFLRVISQKRNPQVTIGYGLRGVPHYAIYVHEMTQVQHSHGEQSKFLSKAVDRTIGELGSRIQAYMKKSLREAAAAVRKAKGSVPKKSAGPSTSEISALINSMGAKRG